MSCINARKLGRRGGGGGGETRRDQSGSSASRVREMRRLGPRDTLLIRFEAGKVGDRGRVAG